MMGGMQRTLFKDQSDLVENIYLSIYVWHARVK